MSIEDELKQFELIRTFDQGIPDYVIKDIKQEREYIDDDTRNHRVITISDEVACQALDALWDSIASSNGTRWERPPIGELIADYLSLQNLREKAKKKCDHVQQ